MLPAPTLRGVARCLGLGDRRAVLPRDRPFLPVPAADFAIDHSLCMAVPVVLSQRGQVPRGAVDGVYSTGAPDDTHVACNML